MGLMASYNGYTKISSSYFCFVLILLWVILNKKTLRKDGYKICKKTILLYPHNI